MNTAIIVQLLFTVISAFVLCFAIVKRNIPRSLYFTFMSFSVFIYNLGYICELTALGLDGAIVARMIQHAVMPFVGMFYFLYILQYYIIEIRKKYMLTLVAAYPVANAVLILAGDRFVPYYKLFVTNAIDPASGLVTTNMGPLYPLFIIYVCTCTAIGLAMTMTKIFNLNREIRRRSLMFFLTSLVPVASYLSILFYLGSARFDIIPGALAVTEVVLGIFMLRFRMVDWAPLARDTILENVKEAFVLADTRGRFLDCNATAQKYFPNIAELNIGSKLSEIVNFPADLPIAEGSTLEFTVGAKEQTYHLRASCSIITRTKRFDCICIMIHDITEITNLMQELSSKAIHDSLTGLYNRSYFLQSAQRELELAERSGLPITLIMLDIDHFKHINDTYGHQCGDKLLAETAARLKGSLRRTDIIGRYGGDEFLIMMPDTNREDAAHVAESLRLCINSMTFYYGGSDISVTASFGAVTQHQRCATLYHTVMAADSAMYRAKKMSRNAVCFDDGVFLSRTAAPISKNTSSAWRRGS